MYHRSLVDIILPEVCEEQVLLLIAQFNKLQSNKWNKLHAVSLSVISEADLLRLLVPGGLVHTNMPHLLIGVQLCTCLKHSSQCVWHYTIFLHSCGNLTRLHQHLEKNHKKLEK